MAVLPTATESPLLYACELWVFAMCPALRGSTVSYAGDAHFPKHSLEYSLNFWSQSKKKKYLHDFHPIWVSGRGGGGGGAPRGLVHNLLMQFFTLGSSKIEVFETCFFDIVITENDYPRYVKHVLGRIYVFSTLFRY